MRIWIETSHELPPNYEQSVFDGLASLIARQAAYSTVEYMTIKFPLDEVDNLASRARVEGVAQYLKCWPDDFFGPKRDLDQVTTEMQLGLIVENASRRARATLPGHDDGRRVHRSVRSGDYFVIQLRLPSTPRIPTQRLAASRS